MARARAGSRNRSPYTSSSSGVHAPTLRLAVSARGMNPMRCTTCWPRPGEAISAWYQALDSWRAPGRSSGGQGWRMDMEHRAR